MPKLPNKVRDIDDIPIAFGMHCGKTPNEISEFNPSYVMWACENVSKSFCSDVLYQYCRTEESSLSCREYDEEYESDMSDFYGNFNQ